MPSPLAATLRQAIATLEQGLIERSAAVRLCLLAALAGEHVLLIGPPGTAKSELARRLHRVVGGERYFERLLTRFSTPEELFGPLSLKALEDDRYERLIDGYLPTAGVGFLDEVFKANSAILNALLTLLNERQFDNGQHRLKVPLISLVGASNEVPADESLQAFHDRFLLRVPVLPVSDAGFEPLLALGTEPPAAAAALTRADIDAVAAQREGVPLPADVRAHLKALRGFTAAQGVTVSDRRWRQLAGLLRTAALGEGRDRVDALDLWLLPYAVAAEPAQVPVLAHWFLADVVQALPQDAPWLTRAVEAFEAQLRIESAAQAEEGDDSAGKLALARRIGGALDSVPMPRLMSATLQAQRHKHYGTLHIAARVAQVDEVLQRAAAHLAEVRARAETTAAALQDRVWLPPELAHRIRHGQAHTLAVLQALQQRLLELRAGFAALPVDGQAAGAPPAAVVLPDEPALAPDA